MNKNKRTLGGLNCSLTKNAIQTVFLSAALFLSNFALAASGGLAAATNEASAIKTWAYGFLGVACFLYLIYHVIMAMADKKPWGDVLMALVHVAGAGAIVVVGDWAWGIWGS